MDRGVGRWRPARHPHCNDREQLLDRRRPRQPGLRAVHPTGQSTHFLRTLRTVCGLRWRDPRSHPSRPGGDETAPQPAEGSGCSGAPEGRCASLRDGPAAHPPPDPLQPDGKPVVGAARSLWDGRPRLKSSAALPSRVKRIQQVATLAASPGVESAVDLQLSSGTWADTWSAVVGGLQHRRMRCSSRRRAFLAPCRPSGLGTRSALEKRREREDRQAQVDPLGTRRCVRGAGRRSHPSVSIARRQLAVNDDDARTAAAELLTLEEAAAVLRTPVATLRYWRHLGVGPDGFRLGRRVVYRRADVDRCVAERQKAQPPRR
jgi:hypothetical protein